LRDTPGVTVLIYDQPCAADLRRKRSRGQVTTPPRQVFINEAVCEGCGDCGTKSNCLSVFPVATEYGRKTQIHQSSCNRDYTCLMGDCPAFVTVVSGEQRRETGNSRLDKSLISSLQSPIPEPTPKVPPSANIYMMGIGGTGVVTVNQILATAASLDGKQVRSLDQTGLSQKGGPVVSHLRISDRPFDISNKIGKGAADAYIVFDVLTGTTEANLAQARSDKTVAIVSSSQIPTGGMVASTAVHFPQGDYFQRRLETVTRAKDNLYLDALQLAENLFGNHMFANVLTIGAAYQAGAIPISATAIERAIELNGAAVEKNKQAFRIGRLVVADPAWPDSLQLGRRGAQPGKRELSAQALALVDTVGAEGELRRLLEIRVPELIAYQNLAYAQDYAGFVKRVLAAELRLGTAGTPLSEAVARYLFKLMAYKDEYEVARLYLQPAFQEAITAEFGTQAKVIYQLHPPLLRELGLKRKVGFGRWFDTVYHLLATLKGLRGTAMDIFGYAKVRRVERQLIGEYRALMEAVLPTLSLDTVAQAVQLAELPDMIRGYEEIKLANVARFREKVQELQAGLKVNGF
jgi:indolepyruvate ferredoxin oxidoreductase